MGDAQTEARAIARFRIDWEHDDTGYPDLVRVWSDDGPFVSYDDHTTALAVKDAELAGVVEDRDSWKAWAEQHHSDLQRAEAQLAEARKALDALTGPEADMRDYHEGVVGCLVAEINTYEAALDEIISGDRLHSPVAGSNGQHVWHDGPFAEIARRAREAQGGENG